MGRKKRWASGIKRVAEALKRYNNFLITSHINLEGDAVGSQIAMAALLKRLGKKYIIFDDEPAPEAFGFIMLGDDIKTRLEKSDRFDVIVSVDCPVLERTGRVARYFKKAGLVINVDHHISNSRFGDIVWIEPNMSSCGEMLYHLYKSLRVNIDKKVALAMYVAIMTDTGSFSYENTTGQTHKVTSELLKAGVKPLWVAKQLNETKSVNDLRLLSETLRTLELCYGGKVAMLHTSSKMFKDLNLGPESAENFVNYARSLNSVKAAIFFLERPDKPGEVHISFRSKGEVNVNEVAALFNGGGHPNASGCVIRGSIAHAKKIILPKIKSFL